MKFDHILSLVFFTSGLVAALYFIFMFGNDTKRWNTVDKIQYKQIETNNVILLE